MPDKASEFLVERHETGGYLVVSSRDGVRMTENEEVWLRNIISVALRADRIGEERSNSRPSPRLLDYDIDPLVTFLGKQHSRRGITFSSFSKALGISIGTLTDVHKGNRRAYLDLVRPWAYMLGFDILPIPLKLRNVVKALVMAWLSENKMDTRFYEEDLESFDMNSKEVVGQ